MLVPVGVTAQYQKAQEKAPLVNVPLENFCITAESPFLTLAGNSSWLQTRIKIPISPHLPWMTLPGVHWIFLMISSSNNPGLKMVEVHADSNLCVKDGIASLSLPIRRGKGNG